MAWKNIKQRSLNDGMLIQHKALTELDNKHPQDDQMAEH